MVYRCWREQRPTGVTGLGQEGTLSPSLLKVLVSPQLDCGAPTVQVLGSWSSDSAQTICTPQRQSLTCSLTSPADITSPDQLRRLPVKASGKSRPEASGNFTVWTQNPCTMNPAPSFILKPARLDLQQDWTGPVLAGSENQDPELLQGNRVQEKVLVLQRDNPDLQQVRNVTRTWRKPCPRSGPPSSSGPGSGPGFWARVNFRS